MPTETEKDQEIAVLRAQLARAKDELVQVKAHNTYLQGVVAAMGRAMKGVTGAYHFLNQYAAKTVSALSEKADSHKNTADHDALTGIKSRPYMIERITHWLGEGRHDDKDQVLCFVHFDLDNFKPKNDAYGHSVGDDYIKHIVKQAKSVLRKGDIFARIGGDEFLILFPASRKGIAINEFDYQVNDVVVHDPLVAAAIVGEKVRKAIAENPMKLKPGFYNGKQIEETILTASVSVGCAVYDPKTARDHNAAPPKVDEVMQIADRAVYHAKKQEAGNPQDVSKNRVSVLVEGLPEPVRYSPAAQETLIQLIALGRGAMVGPGARGAIIGKTSVQSHLVQ